MKASRNLLSLALLLTILLWGACKKEEPSASGGPLPDSIEKGRSRCAETVKLACGGAILAFSDAAHYQAVYDCLDNECSVYNDAVEQQYGYLGEDDYNTLLDNMGYNEEQPLIDFETAHSFFSLRQQLYDAETQWLQAGNDPEFMPDNECIADPIQQTLYSTMNAVMIGGVILVTDRNCEQWLITNGDCNLIQQIYNDPKGVNDPGAQKAQHIGANGECRYNELDKGTKTSGNRKAKWRFGQSIDMYDPYNPTGVFLAVQRTYKKKLGIWMRHRAEQTMDMDGTASDSNCDENSFAATRSDRRWRMKLTHAPVKYYFGLPIKLLYFKPCSVSTEYTAPSIVHTVKLPSGC